MDLAEPAGQNIAQPLDLPGIGPGQGFLAAHIHRHDQVGMAAPGEIGQVRIGDGAIEFTGIDGFEQRHGRAAGALGPAQRLTASGQGLQAFQITRPRQHHDAGPAEILDRGRRRATIMADQLLGHRLVGGAEQDARLARRRDRQPGRSNIALAIGERRCHRGD